MKSRLLSLSQRNRIVFYSLVALLAYGGTTFAAQPEEIIAIWGDQGAADDQRELAEEADFTKDEDVLIADRRIIKLGNVKVPQMHVYLPPENIRTGASIVICPGGGFSILAWDLEGTEIAQFFTNRGVAAIVLKYRVPTRSEAEPSLFPAQDLQRSISLLRSRCEPWKLDPEKIAAMGFSAGGSTVVRAATSKERLYEAIDAADELSWKANRLMLIYSAGMPTDSSPETTAKLNLDENFPPVFMVHTFDDFVPVTGPAHLLVALKSQGVPTELHVFDAGGHGYGLRPRKSLPVTEWADLATRWLQRANWIDSAE